MQQLLLVRHLESVKNLADAFSSAMDDEELTKAATRDVTAWAAPIVKWINAQNEPLLAVHCASSRRAAQTAASIASPVKVPVIEHEKLRSPHVGTMAGVSAETSKQRNPEFMEQLRLYRLGLFNAHHFTAPGMEQQNNFEHRVETCLAEILTASRAGLTVVVAHRAALTAILISAAREAYGYPRGFAGYVELSLGHASLLTRDDGGHWTIHQVNEPADQLLQDVQRQRTG